MVERRQTRSMTRQYGYKKLMDNYIATLEILGNTNEDRVVYDRSHAAFRTDSCKVLSIQHMFTGEFCTTGHSVMYFYSPKIVYNVGDVINVECTLDHNDGPGIHYFRSKEAAFSCALGISSCPTTYSGQVYYYTHNGEVYRVVNFENGIPVLASHPNPKYPKSADPTYADNANTYITQYDREKRIYIKWLIEK